MNLTDKDIDRILKIIDDSGYEEVKIEVGDFKLHVRRGATAASPEEPASGDASATARALPGAPAPAVAAPIFPPAQEVPEGLVAVRAPLLGTFYRAASPGARPFVEVGDAIAASDTVCLIEVMKLYNSVKAGADGVIVKILAENGAMVEHGEVLMLIEHSLVDASAELE